MFHATFPARPSRRAPKPYAPFPIHWTPRRAYGAAFGLIGGLWGVS